MEASTKVDLLSSHVDQLLWGARRLTRNESDARDLVQETCLRALESLKSMGETPGNVRGWLHVIMRHTWFNVVRSRRTQRNAQAELAGDGVDSSLVEMRASYVQFARAWQQLPVTTQFIATECLLHGEPHDVVSERVGVATATIATTIHRTRKQLRASLFGN